MSFQIWSFSLFYLLIKQSRHLLHHITARIFWAIFLLLLYHIAFKVMGQPLLSLGICAFFSKLVSGSSTVHLYPLVSRCKKANMVTFAMFIPKHVLGPDPKGMKLYGFCISWRFVAGKAMVRALKCSSVTCWSRKLQDRETKGGEDGIFTSNLEGLNWTGSLYMLGS